MFTGRFGLDLVKSVIRTDQNKMGWVGSVFLVFFSPNPNRTNPVKNGLDRTGCSGQLFNISKNKKNKKGKEMGLLANAEQR